MLARLSAVRFLNGFFHGVFYSFLHNFLHGVLDAFVFQNIFARLRDRFPNRLFNGRSERIQFLGQGLNSGFRFFLGLGLLLIFGFFRFLLLIVRDFLVRLLPFRNALLFFGIGGNPIRFKGIH